MYGSQNTENAKENSIQFEMINSQNWRRPTLVRSAHTLQLRDGATATIPAYIEYKDLKGLMIQELQAGDIIGAHEDTEKGLLNVDWVTRVDRDSVKWGTKGVVEITMTNTTGYDVRI